MKLRIFNNSIRLRLGQGEVARLADEGFLESKLEIAPQSALTYRLVAEEASLTPNASFSDDRLEISFPAKTVRRWAQGNDVSIAAEQENGAGTLRILIEKDFQCLHHEGSRTDADTFPNPALQA